ncbi:MAG: shikimate dehydrogenase, partial [Bacteroidota bacterium]
IINTTPLGTAPNVKFCPDLNYEQLDDRHFLYDLVYNPEKTLFLENGERKGSHIMNGLPMLIGQAEAAWKIWTQTGQ